MGTGQLLAIKHPLGVDTDSGCGTERVGGLRRSSENVSGDGFVAGAVVRRIAWSDDRGVLREDRPPFVLVAGRMARRVGLARCSPPTTRGRPRGPSGDPVRARGPRAPRSPRDRPRRSHRHVVGLLDAEQLEQAVLARHSYAGIVITAVADRRPERLDTVVWLNRSPASDGTAIIECGSSVGCWRRMRAASWEMGDRLTRGPASGSATCPGARPVFEDADR